MDLVRLVIGRVGEIPPQVRPRMRSHSPLPALRPDEVEGAAPRAHARVFAREIVEAVERDRGAEEVTLRDHRCGAVAAIGLPHDRNALDVGISVVGGVIDLRQNRVTHILNGIASLALRAQRNVDQEHRIAARREDLHRNRIRSSAAVLLGRVRHPGSRVEIDDHRPAVSRFLSRRKEDRRLDRLQPAIEPRNGRAEDLDRSDGDAVEARLDVSQLLLRREVAVKSIEVRRGIERFVARHDPAPRGSSRRVEPTPALPESRDRAAARVDFQDRPIAGGLVVLNDRKTSRFELPEHVAICPNGDADRRERLWRGSVERNERERLRRNGVIGLLARRLLSHQNCLTIRCQEKRCLFQVSQRGAELAWRLSRSSRVREPELLVLPIRDSTGTRNPAIRVLEVLVVRNLEVRRENDRLPAGDRHDREIVIGLRSRLPLHLEDREIGEPLAVGREPQTARQRGCVRGDDHPHLARGDVDRRERRVVLPEEVGHHGLRRRWAASGRGRLSARLTNGDRRFQQRRPWRRIRRRSGGGCREVSLIGGPDRYEDLALVRAPFGLVPGPVLRLDRRLGEPPWLSLRDIVDPELWHPARVGIESHLASVRGGGRTPAVPLLRTGRTGLAAFGLDDEHAKADCRLGRSSRCEPNPFG